LNLKLEKCRIRVKLTPYNLSTAILTALASRIFIIFNAILGSYFIPIVNPNAWDTGLPILNLFARWDAGHYFRVADQGYDRSNLAAFPLYPLILKITSTPLEPFMPKLWALNIASFTISNIFFFISIIGLYRLTYKVFQDNRIAFASTAFLSFYPTSVFLSAAYAESLTLALTLWSFLMLEERKLVKSSILAFLAGLSRPIGFLASVPILLSGLKDRSIKEIALAMFSASSIIVFDAYRYTLTGNFNTLSTLYWLLRIPLSKPALIFNDLSSTVEINTAVKILSTITIMIAIASCAVMASKVSKYTIYSIALLAAYFFFASMEGFMRYSLMIITLYWLLAYVSAKNRVIETILLCGTSMLLGLLTVIYANWYELV